MNEDILKQILDELQQTSKFNRSIARSYFMFLVVIVILAFISPFVIQKIRSQQQHPQSFQAEESQSWHQVHNLLDQEDFEKALSLASSLVKKSPNYWYGYSYLGTIYLAMGDLRKSEENYIKAYDLYPDTENEKAIKAVRKRIASKK